ncbi:ATP-binding cassette domain-containing protein, partial [Kitasatospora sp. NPDC047058]|uniref:ABC transporter ATP-binding protein n=1 Tax=Kitasatospora sp. NPDC047058 TaxID=3155620 RepID=UPI00341133D6
MNSLPEARTAGPAPTYQELQERALAAVRPKAPGGGDAAIVCDRLVRIFSSEGIEVQALQGLELTIRQGDLVALVGASGSGKSTLLTILAGLDVPTAGTAVVAGRDLLEMSARDRLRYRREVVGFIWQQTARNLLPFLTAAENVALPMQLRGRRSGGGSRQQAARVAELLEALEIGDLAHRRPGEMSGGQQQRGGHGGAGADKPPHAESTPLNTTHKC